MPKCMCFPLSSALSDFIGIMSCRYYRYGRFSKSIKPSECGELHLSNVPILHSAHILNIVCGACKEGTLVPLFPVKAGVNGDNSKLSRMAASKPQGMPIFMLYMKKFHRLSRVASDSRTQFPTWRVQLRLRRRITGWHHGINSFGLIQATSYYVRFQF